MKTKHFFHRVLWLLIPLLTLFTVNVWGDTYYKKINSLADVTTGDYVIIGCKTSTSYGLLTYGTLSSNRIPYTSSYSAYGSLPTTITNPAGASVWTLTVTVTNGVKYVTLYNATNSKYIASNAGTHDGKYKYDSSSGLSFTIQYSSGSYGTFRMFAGSTYYLGVNKSANYWRGYASGTLTDTYGLTLYKKAYAVTYNNNGGSGTMTDSNSPYVSGSTVTVKTNTFTAPSGKTFDKWNTKANGSGQDFSEGATFSISKDTTFYAQWESAAPASPAKTVYLKPNAIWNVDGARFAVYYWKSANTSDNAWLDMTSFCGPNFKATIPEGYDKFIFCRMDGSKAANNWDNKWNQTLDLDKPAANDTCYTISSINGCTDSKSCGSWGTYTCPSATTIYLNPNSIWDADGARFAAYYWEGEDSHWVDFEAACGAVTTEIPGGYTNIILCRMNGATATNNWSNTWNQTENQVTTGHNNYVFTISSINGCTDGKSCGAWTTYAIPTYTISYAKGTVPTGGGSISGSKSNESKTCGTAFTLPSSAVFTTTGYTQDGWATSDGGSKAYNLGGSYTTNAAQAFYPHWNANSYTLTWNLAGGTVTTAGTGAAVDATGSPSSSVAYYTAITAPVVEKEGYNFTGWNTTPATNMPAANTTYTAQWSIANYAITWSVNGTATTSLSPGPAATGSSNANYGTKVNTLTFPTAAFMDAYSCGDRTFVGWTNTSSYTHGTSPLFKTAAEAGNELAISAATTFYAVFAEVNTTNVMSETFDNERTADNSTAITTSTYSNFSGSTSKAFEGAYGTLKLGSSSAYGYVTSKSLDLSSNFSVTFKAKKHDSGACVYVAISTDGSAFSQFDTIKSASLTSSYQVFTLNFSAADNTSYIKIGSCTGYRAYIDSVVVKRTSSSNHSLTCVSCNSVTLSIGSAANGTMTVKKGETSLSNGATVNTCSEQTLKVKVTPNTHYRLTAMTISGGSVSVSPSTSTGLPSASEIEYTVTIPADATGTVTISPTITATPTKTVVFKTNGESSGASNQTVYVGEAPTMPDALDAAAACDDDYDTFYGWTQATWSGTKVPSEMAELTGSDEVFLPGASGVTVTDSDPATITYNAVWADGTATTTYTKLTSNSFSTSATYVISNGTYYLNSCTKTDANNSWGYCTSTPASETPLYFKLSGTAGQLVVKSTEATARYLKPLSSGDFQMSASVQKDSLTSSGEIYNPGTGYRLRYNSSGLRWYNSTTGSAAYFYAVGLKDDANYLTHCCTKYTITGASTSGTSVTGGTLTSTFNSVCADNDVKITATVSEGYRFDGWSITAGSSTVSRKAGSAETEGGNPIYVFTMPSANVTVSATITRVYSVTYAANSGTGTMTDANKYAAGATVTVKSNTFSRSGYNWSSWSYSPSVTVTNGKFTMPSSDVTITANWTAKPLESISLSAASGTVYVDQYADFTVTYDPADYISPGYTLSATPVYVTKVAQAPANTLLRLKGGRGSGPGASITETQTETVTIKASGDNTKTASVTMTVNPLPRVHFVDLVHGKEFADVVATIADNELNASKTTKTSVDWTTPNYNDCETNHLHLVGWIREDWPALTTYLNGGDQPSTSAITTAGNDGSGNAYYFEAGASINVQTFNGVTFYAVWAKVE